MKPLIKAKLYQVKRSRFIFVIFFVLIAAEMISYLGGMLSDEKISAGGHLTINGVSLLFVAIIFGIVFTGFVCGQDFTDKTLNYEMMSGHTRKNIYFSHALISIIGGTVGTVMLILIPMIFAVFAYGWGNEINAGQAVVRLLVATVVLIRVLCEFVCLTYITKSPYITMACAYGVMMAGMILETSNKYSAFLGITSFNRLVKFDAWMTYTLDDTVNLIMVYDAGLPKDDIVAMILSSVFFGGLFLWIGYKYFSKDDMN